MSLEARELLGLLRFTLSMVHVLQARELLGLLRFTLSMVHVLQARELLGLLRFTLSMVHVLQARELLGLLRFTLSMFHVFKDKGAAWVIALYLVYGSCLYRQGSCLGYCALPCLWFMSLQARELLGLLRFTLSMVHVFTGKGTAWVIALHLVYGSCLYKQGSFFGYCASPCLWFMSYM